MKSIKNNLPETLISVMIILPLAIVVAIALGAVIINSIRKRRRKKRLLIPSSFLVIFMKKN
ncbi:MAG: hypothetical protein ACTSVA_03860 [Candidatus Njordarchaeales archaeon]